MSRRAVMTMVVAAGALAGASAAVATVPTVSEKRDARVRVANCSRDHHAAAFNSRMRTIAGAEQMWMRFRVLERLGTTRFEPVRAPGLGRWRKSRPGVLVFRFRQRVRGLAEGADYRARVDYRWLDADGEVIRRARRRSGVCRQHGRLPNLQVLGISTRPTLATGTSEYAVQIWNSGRAPALGASVDLFVDHTAVDRQTVSSIGPGEIVRARFVGPSCERYDSPVAAVVDSDATILESREDDNRRDARCGDI